MRNEKLLSIRPTLPLSIEGNSEPEKFQNITLRPILKFQHDILISVLKSYIEIHNKAFYTSIKNDQINYIEMTIKTDTRFKNKLLGLIIGLFTVEEYAFYHQNETELSRRLRDLIIQRLTSVDQF